ncbi:MAG TPA: YidC/Oxa1 family membrane protein insertase, partial [Candidatus Saccharimonadales bacterium]|nr:YidC/Oxa1 family membrane protein insertase [Candidatus Saccharimonadales bacterium]
MFTTIIVQPIFNLLVLIYTLIPGHNFGLAIIIFTILIRLLMWPLVKKQLHHAKAIRELAPEIKKIKAQAAGDKQKQRTLTMELYKEREVNPLGSLGIIAVQAVIFIGLYLGLSKVIKDPQQIISFSYSPLHDLGWMKTLAEDIKQFDATLFGLIDLHRTAVGKEGLYFPALLLALGSAVAQFFQGRQLMPKSQDARSLRQILKEAGKGNQADQQEVNVAVGRSTLYLLPIFVFVISLNFPAALPLYWFTGSFF